MKIIDEIETQKSNNNNNKKKKQKQKQRQKRTRGTEAIVKGWELNYYDVHLS